MVGYQVMLGCFSNTLFQHRCGPLTEPRPTSAINAGAFIADDHNSALGFILSHLEEGTPG